MLWTISITICLLAIVPQATSSDILDDLLGGFDASEKAKPQSSLEKAKTDFEKASHSYYQNVETPLLMGEYNCKDQLVKCSRSPDLNALAGQIHMVQKEIADNAKSWKIEPVPFAAEPFRVPTDIPPVPAVPTRNQLLQQLDQEFKGMADEEKRLQAMTARLVAETAKWSPQAQSYSTHCERASLKCRKWPDLTRQQIQEARHAMEVKKQAAAKPQKRVNVLPKTIPQANHSTLPSSMKKISKHRVSRSQ